MARGPQILGVGWDSDAPAHPSRARPLLALCLGLIAGAVWGIRVGGRWVAAGTAGPAAGPVALGRDCLVTCDMLLCWLALLPEVGVWARGYLESCAMH